MSRVAVVALMGFLGGCASSTNGVGIKGNLKSRDEEQVAKTDMKSVSLRKGALVAEHDIIADSHCGGRCLFRRKALAHLELTIDPQGVAKAVDKGEQVETFESAAGDTEHKLVWDRLWSGSWTEGRGELVLTLRPERTACERREASGAAAEDPCSEVPLVLECQAGSITLHEPKNQVARAWVCRPRGRVASKAGMTPFPWIFGVDYQVDTSDRGHGNRIDRFFLGEPPEDNKKKSKT